MSSSVVTVPSDAVGGVSSSVMLTVVVAVVPALTRDGSMPKVSFTLSPSSSKLSWVAVKAKDV